MKRSIQKYDFKQGLALPFEVVDLSSIYAAHREQMTHPHRVSFYQVIWFTEGQGEHMVDFKPVAIRPDTILFLNQGTVQKFAPHHTFAGWGLLFTEEFYCRNEADIRYLNSSTLFHDLLGNTSVDVSRSVHLLRSLLRLMQTELQREKDEVQGIYLQNLLHNFLLLAERQKKAQGSIVTKKGVHLEYVIRFKKTLNQDFKAHKTVSYYAHQLGLSEKRLNQASQAVLGKSPKQTINDRVVLEAKRLIAHSNDSIKAIGYALGFDEPTNFIKYFRQHAQLTPLEFRRAFATS